METYKKGKIVKGTVTGIEDYGIFISLDEFYTGLIHISEISHGFVKDVNEFVNIGEIIYVEILEVSENTHRAKLSIKNIPYRTCNIKNKRVIEETGSKYKLLKEKLPIWIEEQLKNELNQQ